MDWQRVVLDEGHIIRNASTKAAVAACNLLSTSRWILSGTPIVNTVKDLHSMLKFLRVTGGLESADLFNSVLARPLADGDPNADVLLESIMRTLCLRRRKEMKFADLKLPPLSAYVHRIQFRDDEKEKYKAFMAEAQGTLQKYQKSQGKNGQDAYRHLLEVLLRLRQVCCHWKLCGERITKLLALLEQNKVIELNSENRKALQTLLQLCIDAQEECPVCLDTLHDPVITACKHTFGFSCLERVIESQRKCPLCRAELSSTDALVHPAPPPSESKMVKKENDPDSHSSKTEALMSILKASLKNPKSKVIIFSQWTSFLNIIQQHLDSAGYKYTRIDGSMSAPQRDAAMTTLSSDLSTRILLASLSVCSVGLNLVAADTVILADSWWAPAIEDQAVDRVHRLGQTRKTTVWRLIMEDSIEERVMEIQSQKRKLVGKAFKEKGKLAGGKTTRMGDIEKLLK
jgi:SWI/SNF-related matrix-associated actin-dependent regulator of chromatin subfamily A3